MRDFEYDPKAIKAEREAKKKLEDELKKQFVSDVTSEYFRTCTAPTEHACAKYHTLCMLWYISLQCKTWSLLGQA